MQSPDEVDRNRSFDATEGTPPPPTGVHSDPAKATDRRWSRWACATARVTAGQPARGSTSTAPKRPVVPAPSSRSTTAATAVVRWLSRRPGTVGS